MASNASSQGSQASRSRGGGGSQTHNTTSNDNKRFPDYILCGSLNLHKSAENAAALVKHIAKQWDFLRINKNGIISSKQLEINRNPNKYGGLRNGKLLTVTEWHEVQKAKLREKRSQEAEEEAALAEEEALRVRNLF